MKVCKSIGGVGFGLGFGCLVCSVNGESEDLTIPENFGMEVRSAVFARANSTGEDSVFETDVRPGKVAFGNFKTVGGSSGSGEVGFVTTPASQPWLITLRGEASGKAPLQEGGDPSLIEGDGKGDAYAGRRATVIARSETLADGAEVMVNVTFGAGGRVTLQGASDEAEGPGVGAEGVSVCGECAVLADFEEGFETKKTFFSFAKLYSMSGRTSDANLFNGLNDKTGDVNFRNFNDPSENEVVGSWELDWDSDSSAGFAVGSGSALASAQIEVSSTFPVTMKVGEAVEVFVDLGVTAYGRGRHYNGNSDNGFVNHTADASAVGTWTEGGYLNFNSVADVEFEIDGILPLKEIEIDDYDFDFNTGEHSVSLNVLDGVNYEVEYSFDLNNWFPLQPLFFEGTGMQEATFFAPSSPEGRLYLRVLGQQ